MTAVQSLKIHTGEYVHVVYQYRLFIIKHAHCLTDAASGIQQQVCLIRQAYVKPEIAVSLKKLPHRSSKVVYVDYETVKTGSLQMTQLMLKHGTAGHLDQCLGAVRCVLTQPGAKSGSKNKGIHSSMRFFCSRCSRTI